MFDSDCDLLRVNVPVGFLLSAPQEIVVSVNRPTEQPLSLRLRLIPAEPPASTRPQSPVPLHSARLQLAWDADDGYSQPDFGGGD